VAGWDQETAGLALLAIAEVPQVMSAFLPSPATARMGFNEGEDVAERAYWLRVGEVVGSGVALALAAAIAMIIRPKVGNAAWAVLGSSVATLAVFLYVFDKALREAMAEHRERDQ
jgi:O-antigen/teichoic acid export membrane protein